MKKKKKNVEIDHSALQNKNLQSSIFCVFKLKKLPSMAKCVLKSLENRKKNLRGNETKNGNHNYQFSHKTEAFKEITILLIFANCSVFLFLIWFEIFICLILFDPPICRVFNMHILIYSNSQFKFFLLEFECANDTRDYRAMLWWILFKNPRQDLVPFDHWMLCWGHDLDSHPYSSTDVVKYLRKGYVLPALCEGATVSYNELSMSNNRGLGIGHARFSQIVMHVPNHWMDIWN